MGTYWKENGDRWEQVENSLDATHYEESAGGSVSRISDFGNLKINIQLDKPNEKEKMDRIKKVQKKVAAIKKEPTMKEIWFTGYTTHTGSFKKGIFQTNLSPKDKERLQMVYEATDSGELPVGVESLKKYTKAHALRMYKVLADSRREATIEKLVAEIPDNYLLINTIPAFEKLVRDLRHEEEIAIDTETTGLNYFGTYEAEVNRIVGISITLPKADYHVYIPFGHSSGVQLPEAYVLEGLTPMLENHNIKKILFNAKFDIHMFRRHGLKLKGFWFDGFVGMKLLNESEPSYALKNLATKYGKHFGFVDKSATFEELFGRGGFQDVPFSTESGERGIGTLYACKDTHLTYKFYKDFVSVHFDRLPKLKRLYYEIEKPILEVCIDMEQNGFLLDSAFAKEYASELQGDIDRLKEELVYHFGEININSNQQLQKVIYEEMRLPDVSKSKSVDAKTLKKLANHEGAEGIKVLLKYRDLNKLLTTYIEPLPLKVAEHDGRLHGTFNQVDTATGRFASKSPNLQNLPKKARKMIIAPHGQVIIGMDFSQIEPRVLSHMADDKDLQQAYIEGKDLYSLMASKVFKIDIEYCLDGAVSPCGTYEPRKRIKAIFLGIMYGMGSGTLSQSIQDSVEVAEALIKDFYDSYPSVKKFVEDTHLEAEQNQCVETMFGRKRRFAGHTQNAKRYKSVVRQMEQYAGMKIENVKKFLREDRQKDYSERLIPYNLVREFYDVAYEYEVVNRKAVNTKIQGSSADIMKLSMIAITKICKVKGYKLLATVHDEVLLEVPETITEEEVNELEKAMLGVVQLKVPMKSDVEFMSRWGTGVNKKKWFEKK